MIKKIILSIIALAVFVPIQVKAATIVETTGTEAGDVLVDEDTRTENSFVDQEELALEKKIEETFEAKWNEKIEVDMKQKLASEVLNKEKVAKDTIAFNWFEATDEEMDQKLVDDAYQWHKEELLEEGNNKMSKWAKEFYAKYKGKITDKVKEYVKQREAEMAQQIEVGVDIVINLAMEPIYNEIEDCVNDSVPVLGSLVSNVLRKYQKTLGWEEKAANEIKMKMGLEVKQQVNESIKEEFDWEEELWDSTCEALGSYSSAVVEDLLDKTTEKLLEKLGIDPGSTSLDLAIADYAMSTLGPAIDYLFDEIELSAMSDKKILEELRREVKDLTEEEQKEAAAALRKQMKKEMNEKIEKLRKQALSRLAAEVGNLAGDYAEELYDRIGDKLYEAAEELGVVGKSIAKSINAQIGNWVEDQVAQNVETLCRNAFFNENGELGIKALKINWEEVGINVLVNIIASNETLSQIADFYLSSVGGMVSGPMLYEEYSSLRYTFMVSGGVLIPTESFATATAAAQTGAAASLARGDIGTFGVAEVGRGYHPLQFLPSNDVIVVTSYGPYMEFVPPGVGLFFSFVPGSPIVIEAATTTINTWIPDGYHAVLPSVPVYADTSYILNEMVNNQGGDSYVQRALSLSTFSIGKGIPFTPSKLSAALNVEAAKFLAFTTETAAAGGFKKAIKDLTKTATARYNGDAGVFVLGPFKVDYVRGYADTNDIRPKAEFGFIESMTIYDQNGNTIPRNSWAIMYSEDGDFDHKTKSGDDDYQFPYPKEEFYIAVTQYDNENVTSISRIEIKYKEMVSTSVFTTMTETFFQVYSLQWHTPVLVGSLPPHLWWYSEYARWAIPYVRPYAGMSVLVTKKFYINHQQTIYLHKKDTAIPGYETAEYTTTSSVKTSGVSNIQVLEGEALNSAIFNSLDHIVKQYKVYGEVIDKDSRKYNKYDKLSTQFTQSASLSYKIFSEVSDSTAYLQGFGHILNAFGQEDAAKAVAAVGALTNKEGKDIQKVAEVVELLTGEKGLRDMATLMENVFDIVMSGEKRDMQKIISLINLAAQQYGSAEYRQVANTVTDILETSEYPEQVYKLLEKNKDGTMSRQEKKAYLKEKYPRLSESAIDDIIDREEAIQSTLYNSGDAGERIKKMMEATYPFMQDVNDIQETVETINGIAVNRKEVATLLEKNASNTMSTAEKKAFLKEKYPDLNDDQINTIIEQEKDVRKKIYASGETGDTIKIAVEEYYPLTSKDVQPTEVMNKVVETIGNKELAEGYRIYDNVVFSSNQKIEEIKNDTTLDENEKNKQIKKENEKMIVATVEATGKMVNGDNKISVITDTYNTISTAELKAAEQYQRIAETLTEKELEVVAAALAKSTDTDKLINTLDLYYQRALQAEKTETFVEVEEVGQLYDRTPYTEYNTQFNITKVERPEKVYYVNDDAMGLTISVAGVVWKDGHSGHENDYDGLRNANTNGDLEKGIEGVKVTLIDVKTNEIGKMNIDGQWVDAITYTDEGGYYHIEEVRSGKYYVDFEYDGQTYMATTTLSDGEKAGHNTLYKLYPDREEYDNNSKAAEDDKAREEFNNKFYEIIEDVAISKDGKTTRLDYETKNGVSTLVTLDDEGHVLSNFAMHATSKNIGVTYPIDNQFTLENETTDLLITGEGQEIPVYQEYKKTGEYMYHINLGLVERSKIDLATTQDVYQVTTTVNEKQEDYIYNQRGILSIFDANLKQTQTYRELAYTREIYNADYQLREEDYQMNDLNLVDKYGNDKTEEIERIKAIKTEEIEGRVFVTYKITLINQSVMHSATINEIKDYFDEDYKLVEEDIYQNIQKADGTVENKRVAQKSFFIIEQDAKATEYPLEWEQTGMENGLRTMRTLQTSGVSPVGLEDVIIGSRDRIYVFVTFEVEKENDALKLDQKQNIVEITSYTSLELGSGNKDNSIGLIDKDSEPDNLSVGYYDEYEDDTDAAPILTLKLYSTDARTINGFVWNDNRTKELSTGQIVGDGIRTDNEEKIDGVRVQLIEKIKDPETGEDLEYVWKEMYTGADDYWAVASDDDYARGRQIIEKDIVSTTNLGAIQKGEYKFHDYVAGNFIVRFIYGDTYRTYLAKGSKTEFELEGLNEASYNGHDYKSTAYRNGADLYSEWYSLDGFSLEDNLYSDAKDNSTRRQTVMKYSEDENETQSFINDRAEVLASADGREDKNYYNYNLHEPKLGETNVNPDDYLRDSTWMFADTAKINVNVEYNREEVSGLEDLSYFIRNIDLGLEKRPETKLELTKEIVDIKVTLASGETIINTAAGLTQNVNWVQNKRHKEEGYNYKRDNLKYTYRQGKVHIYMDEEIMQGTNIQITYRLTVTNKGEVDYTGKNGDLGYVYYTGEVSANDQIVTTKVDKIIDYVDNSLTFRKADNPSSTNNTEGWKLIEDITEFKPTEEEIGEQQNQNAVGVNLNNYEVIQKMKADGYLNKDLEMIKTKTGRVEDSAITQIIVTDELENTELKPGENATVQLILTKTLSPQDEDTTLDYSNMAEILEYTNKVGRRDMDAIPGNQQPNADPDKEEFEYDTDFTERVIITPPTGENKAFYYVITTLGLAIFTLGIVLIKKLVLGKK